MSTCLGKASFCFWAEFQTFEVGQNCKTKKEHRESSFFFKFSKTKIKDFNMDFSLFSPKNLANLIKTKKKVRESYQKIVDFQNLMKIEFCQRLFFAILTIHNLPWGHVRSHKKNLCPIGSAVLTFIGYKQTDRHHDKQRIYIQINPLQRPSTFLFCTKDDEITFKIF